MSYLSSNRCKLCKSETKNPKFCSNSCAASYNNKGVRRNGRPAGLCKYCKGPKKEYRRKYCSIECFGKANTKHSERDKKMLNREAFMRYYTRKINQTPPDADLDIIKEIYKNCPDGYEVDHIIPISKGGLHHQDNLQYLTINENRTKSNKLDWIKKGPL